MRAALQQAGAEHACPVAHTHTLTHSLTRTNTHTHAHTHTHTHTHKHTRTHTHTHTHTYTHTHTHTHTHSHTTNGDFLQAAGGQCKCVRPYSRPGPTTCVSSRPSFDSEAHPSCDTKACPAGGSAAGREFHACPFSRLSPRRKT